MSLCVLASLDLLQHPPGITQHDLPTFRIPVSHPQRVAAAVGDNACPASQQHGRPTEHSCKAYRSTSWQRHFVLMSFLYYRNSTRTQDNERFTWCFVPVGG
jgi:hypothetical protein